MRSLVLFLKANIPAGARWVTAHPNGPGEKGQPILIQPQADGSAKVLGGAGGALNHLRIRSVRSEAEYKAESDQKKKAQAEAKKEQVKADKEAGIYESKKKVQDQIRDQKRKHEREFVQTVAEAAGWDKKAVEPDETALATLSDAARQKALNEHHRSTLAAAKEFVQQQRQRLATDHEARAEAGIGEVPLTAPAPEQLSVEDIAPVQTGTSGLGFAPEYEKRAEANGLTKDELKKEVEAAKPLTDDQRKAKIKRGEAAKEIKKELEQIRDPVPKNVAPDLIDAKKAADLLRAEKKLKALVQKAKAANKEVAEAKTEPKAFVLEVAPDPDEEKKIEQELDDELRTIATHNFLSEVGKIAGGDPQATLGKHIGVGAYNAINAVALAVGGDALIDRSVVDVLGIAGAAQVLARRVQRDLADDAKQIADGMSQFHLDTHASTTEQALQQARELMDAAKAIDLPDGETATDLQTAQELNAKRRAAVTDAQKLLGHVYGEMEANASLAAALARPAKDKLEVPMGKSNVSAAITQARALGLQRGDYTVEQENGQTWLTVNATGMDRLAKPVNRDDVMQVRRNLAIMNGDEDEDGWLPMGVARRPDLDLKPEPGVAQRIGREFAPGEGADLEQHLRDYIGGRAADGDTPADIVADIQSSDFFRRAGDQEAYRAALDKVAPLTGADGKQVRAETLGEAFDGMADEFTQRTYGGARSPLNRQQVQVDQTTVDALHRALADHPEGVAAYKSIGDLDHKDQRALREFFHREIAKEDPEAAATRQQLEAHTAAEPERETEDMFGDRAENPEWTEWNGKRDELAGKLKAGSLDWVKYAETHRGHEKAYESIQDLIRSRVSASFAKHHNTLRPGAPLKVGRSVIRNNLNHLDATDPGAREQRQQRERELVDGLRERSAGRYAAGSVSDKLDAARDEREAFEQAQMGFFASDDTPAPEKGKLTPDLKAGDERHTLGHVVDRQLAALTARIGGNFKPGQPTKLFNPTMSGGKNAARQRLVKMVDANKRVVAAFGTGSGKSLLQLASFTHLHEQGKVKRGLFLVPSIVQGQFNGEALRFLEPDKYKWHIQPGASRDERIAAYKDPSNHFAVMTHQSFRDDMMHLGAQHAGIEPGAMADKLQAMNEGERKDWMKSVMEREGINFDYLTVDESQQTLNRAGKENSGLANVVDALSHHTPYYMLASGDPVKNDASEVHDLLRKMDPARYADRAAFMRRYGADTIASKDALKREMSRYVFPSKIDPDVHADRREETVELDDNQKKQMADMEQHLSAARLARMRGKVDVDAVRALSPSSFEGVPAEQHEEVAKGLQASIGMIKTAAMKRVLNNGGAKLEKLAQMAHERRGKPGVVFAHSLEAVQAAKKRLEAEGHRVVLLTGADSSQEKERKRLMFNPEGGDAQADIMIASDAGATGMNIQRGQWLVNLDTPDTAMVHGQRQGRIFRTGQKNNVELVDLVANHAAERTARDRLAKKYQLRNLMTSPMEGLDDTGVAAYLHGKRVQDDANAGLF
ncbi:MAG: helicase-related protein [Leptothrix sp. (in: b-proteobacteria)]